MKINKEIIWIIALILLSSIAQAAIQEVGNFDNCSGYTFYIEITGLGPIYTEGYNIPQCEFVSEKTNKIHDWICKCENNSLNITIDSNSILSNTFSVSVIRLNETLNPSFEELFSKEKNSTTKTIIKINNQTKGFNLITAKVTFSKTKGWSSLGIIIIILIILGINLKNKFGGMPWTPNNERVLNLHKKGQQAFEKSKIKKAKLFYRRASKLRNKNK